MWKDKVNLKTFVFDLDNTLCKTKSNDYKNATPIKFNINKVNRLYDSGNIIKIYTARGMGRYNDVKIFAYLRFKILTTSQLKNWGLKYHKLFFAKPCGDYYIDDKSMSPDEFFKKISK